MIERPSGRSPDELRDVRFTRGYTAHAAGSVLVEFGGTRVICTASVVDLQRDRFRMDYHVYSASRQQIAAKGGGLVVSYDYRSNTKVDLPEHWRAAIERLESR